MRRPFKLSAFEATATALYCCQDFKLYKSIHLNGGDEVGVDVDLFYGRGQLGVSLARALLETGLILNSHFKKSVHHLRSKLPPLQ